MSRITDLQQLPADPVYGLQAEFKQDTRPEKINLSIGVCTDSQGAVYRFKAVDLAEAQVQAKAYSKTYLPITGVPSFCEHVRELICKKNDSVFCVQTLGATGALYLAARLLRSSHIYSIYLPEHTWVNHKPLFTSAGHDVYSYPYYNKETGTISFSAMCEAIRKMPEYSAIVLQGSCHNPTGMDLHTHHYHTLSPVIKEKKLTVIFDLAYQGLGMSLDDDVKGINIFLKDNHECLIATTFAKNFGLYNERVGALLVSCEKEYHAAIKSHVQAIIRSCYSSPPAHGAQIACAIFEDSRLLHLWHKELHALTNRLKQQRKMLYEALEQKKPNFSYEHLLRTNGLFCLFDIPEEKVYALKEDKALYISLDGRVCISAINENNVEQIAQGLSSAK